ncbi:hypothetical protein DC3_44520 [Deinococcus cellulosilyticus NBRC 106333 = KACC 11606]|uniref:Uncharacterized protein n=1 Tax=Deinococcus cellulosilyticus (strain DSM 18568 / NBRC 106333 / KACC 11606 / 5516J-15) TaxID=1223518 RepID=A0A511N8G3_DEIC1|nr:hypothetical protein DC3_44520 [Deinococcus cellulosilyticus NBRC 106333 = KACC 11606]
MAGLECDKCLQPTRVIDNGKTETDADGRVIYRRYRVCANPTCPMFRIRRESVELWLPDEGNPFRVSARELNLVEEPEEDPWQPSLWQTSSAKQESTQTPQNPKEPPPKRK